jgi:hypothetical protein
MKITEKQILEILEAVTEDLLATKQVLEALHDENNQLILETINCELENRGQL